MATNSGTVTTHRDRTDALICAALGVLFFLAIVICLAARDKSAPARPRISNASTYAQVVANFTGRPYSTGAYVTGYRCAGYTAGKDGHGWVVIRCQK